MSRQAQNSIDRRFYCRTYDAAQTLAAFAATARDDADLEQLAGRLARVVQDTMQPARLGLWPRPTADQRVPEAASDSR